MSKALISIVTISYNQKEFLRQTIESVLAGKNEDVEYIVVDGGSSDGSLELIKSYSDKIDHVVSGPDQGPADGLNKGFERASGRVGYFLNSDDFLMPQGLSILRKNWTQSPLAEVFLAGAWMVDQRGLPLRELRPVGSSVATLLNGAGRMVQQGLSFSLERYRKIGGFNVQNRTCWDLELLCHLLKDGPKPVGITDRIGAFRLHGASLTGGAAGQSHELRYQKDLQRLRTEFAVTSEATPLLSRVMQSPHNIIDRLLPWRINRRFAADCRSHEA